jgi:CDP-glucose 4,6-dehydratase
MVYGDFYRGKRVFLTGHTGFKGAWLSLWLQQMGAEVTGYALEPSTDPSLFEVADVATGMRSVIGDIRDAGEILRAMQAAAPELVFHLAAQPLVRLSYAQPVETYATNVLGTVHVLEAIRQTHSVRAAVNVTSDKCYENREWIWPYRESDRLGGHDPYSNSKACSELITAAYRSSFFSRGTPAVALATARAGNVIGGGDWAPDRLLPDILRAQLGGRPLEIRNPRAVRPWQHVLEPLSGYLLLAQRLWEGQGAYAEAWNFGPEATDARPVSWVVEQVAALFEPLTARGDRNRGHPHEAGHLTIDSSKARQRLGWTPRWPVGRAIQRVVEWHRSHLAGADMREVCVRQIADYASEQQQ